MKNLLFQNGDKMPALWLGGWMSLKNEVYEALLDCSLIICKEIIE